MKKLEMIALTGAIVLCLVPQTGFSQEIIGEAEVVGTRYPAAEINIGGSGIAHS